MKSLNFIGLNLLLIILICTNTMGQINPTPHCGGLCTFTQITADHDIRSIKKSANTIWLGTSAGLIEYDISTDSYQKYTTNEGLRNNNIIDLAVDGDNDILWIATAEGLCKMEADDCFYFEDGFMANNSPYQFPTRRLELDDNNVLWVLSAIWAGNGLFTYDEPTGNVEGIYNSSFDPNSLPGEPLDIKPDANGNMWILLDPEANVENNGIKKLARYTNGSITDVVSQINATVNTHDWIGSLQIDNDGNPWISNNNDLYKYEENTNQLITQGVSSVNSIMNFGLSYDNNVPTIWFAHPYSNQIYQNIQSPIPFVLNDRINDVYIIDNEPWAATRQGIQKLNTTNNTFQTHLIIDDEIQCNYVKDLASADNGEVWVAYLNCLQPLARFNNGIVQQHYSIPNVGGIDYVLFDGNKIWFHTRNQIYEQANAGSTTFDLIPEISNVYYTSDMVYHDGQVYIGGYDSNTDMTGLYTIDNGIVQIVMPLDTTLHSIATDENGSLYFATANGLYVYENNQVSMISPVQFRHLVFDSTNNFLWLQNSEAAWNEQHLYQYDGNTISPASYYSNGASAMALDNSGVLWIGDNKVQNSSGQGPFSNLDGLPGDRCNAIAADSENNIWIGTGNGIAVYEEENFIAVSANEICKGESITFSQNVTGLQNYFWTIKSFYGNDTIYSSQDAQFSYTFNQPGNYTVSLSAEINACVKTDINSILVHGYAAETGISSSYTLCDNSTIQLYGPGDMMTYEWMFDGNIVGTERVLNTNEMGNYTLYIEDYCGGSASLNTSVIPELTFSIYCNSIDVNTVKLTTTTIYEANATYIWSNGAETSSIEVPNSGVYSVTVTLNGCTASASIDAESCMIVSTEETQTPSFKVYPNPVSETLFIQNDADDVLLHTLRLYNISGQLIREQKMQATLSQLDFSSYASGVYILDIEAENGQHFQQKIVKK